MMKASFLFLFLICGSLFAKEVPRLTAAVTDHANMISASTETTLNRILKQVNRQGQIQMAIYTINDLEDESLEGYSIKVVDQWKLGSAKKDNGLLLLIVKKQRKMRLEVGQGLEGDIPDASAGRIIDEMKSYFKTGEFDHGILLATIRSLQSAGIKIEGLSKIKAISHKKPPQSKLGFIINILVLIGFVFLFIRNPFLAMLILSGGGRRGGFGGGGGGSFGGGGGGFSGGGASGGW